MSINTHKCEVVPIKLEPHPNATSLSIVKVFDHYTVCVKTQDFSKDTKGVYFPPDSVIPDDPAFYLPPNYRITTHRFRGVLSIGLLVPLSAFKQVSPDTPIGTDLREMLGVTHYEPVVNQSKDSSNGTPPPNSGPTYNVESWFKYGKYFEKDEIVEITEKIHGANFRVTYQSSGSSQGLTLYVASHNRYVKRPLPHKKNIYYQALDNNPWLLTLAENHPNYIFYGEVFGYVQVLHYGATKTNPYKIVVFDIYDASEHRWLALDERNSILGLDPQRRPPVLYLGPYSPLIVHKLMNGDSTIEGAHHLREGIIIRPPFERCIGNLDRLILKAVSPKYLASFKYHGHKPKPGNHTTNETKPTR